MSQRVSLAAQILLIAALLGLFVIVQVADAWLTAFGIDRFGVSAEANPMLALPVILSGSATARTIAKGLSVLGGVVLTRFPSPDLFPEWLTRIVATASYIEEHNRRSW